MIGVMPQHKKIATLILGDSGAKAPEVPNDGSMGVEAACDKMFAALEAKDKAAFMAGFKEAFTMLFDEQEMLEDSMEG